MTSEKKKNLFTPAIFGKQGFQFARIVCLIFLFQKWTLWNKAMKQAMLFVCLFFNSYESEVLWKHFTKKKKSLSK